MGAADRTVTVRLQAVVDSWKRNMRDAGKSVDDLGSKTSKNSKEADKSLRAMGASAKVSGRALAVGLAAGAYAAYKLAGAASDLAETQSKVKQIFGASADELGNWSDEAATALGQSKQQALDAASTFGIFGKSAGLAGSDLVDFSKKTTALATDLASFNNTSPEDAITALGAALRGESEPIRRYGVLLDDATLRNRALQMGLISTTKDALTPQQRVLAAYNEILAQTATQQGDFARTSDGMANSQRIAAAEFANTKAELGASLVPALTDLFQVTSKVLGAFNALPGPVRNTTVVVAALGAVAVYLAPKILAARTAFRQFATEMPGAASKIGTATKAVGALGAAYAAYLAIHAATHASASDLSNFADEVAAAAGPTTQDKIAGLTEKMNELYATADQGGVRFFGGGVFWSDAAGDAADKADELKQRIKDLESQQKVEAATTANSATEMVGWTNVTKDATGATGEQSDAVQDLKKAMDALNGATLSEREAHRGYQQAIDDATKSLKDNGKTLDVHTQKGRDNAAALDGIATAAEDELVALDASGASAKTVGKRHDAMRADLIKAGRRFGLTKAEAEDYANAVLAIPAHVSTTAEFHILTDIATIGQHSRDEHAPSKKKAGGGLVVGYGTGTSDSVPTNLSNGEFVMRASAVRKIGVGTLSAMNQGRGGRGGTTFAPQITVNANGLNEAAAQRVAQSVVNEAFDRIVHEMGAE